MLFTLSASLASALLAEGARSAERLAKVQRDVVRVVLLIVPPAGFLFCGVGPAVLACFGTAYRVWGGPMVPVLALAALPDACTNLATAIYRAHGAWQAATVLNLLMPSVALVLAWFWLPDYGLVGDVWAWLLGQSAGTGLVLVRLARARWRCPSRA